MNSSEIMKIITDLEQEFPVDQWRVDGIHVWPLIRINIYTSIFSAPLTNTSTSTRKSKLSAAFILTRGFLKFIRAYYRDYASNSRPDHQIDAVFLSDGLSYSLVRGRWFESFCDPIISLLNEHGSECFLLSPSHSYFTPRQTPSMYIKPYFTLIRIRSLFIKPKKLEVSLPGIDDVVEKLRLNSLPVGSLDVSSIVQNVRWIRAVSSFYKKILTSTAPKIAFQSCYYGVERMAFNLACRELGIPSVDIQHGLQGDLHVAYGNWSKVPKNGYELLPTIFWCWSNEEAMTINRWNREVSRWHRPYIGGDIKIEEWRKGSDDLQSSYDKTITDVTERCASKNHVLVTLQPWLADDVQLASLLQAAERTQNNWHWWFRLHPSMIGEEDRIRQMLLSHNISNYELEIATDLPLYNLLNHLDVHLTHCSSCVLEAERFDVPSVVFSEFGSEFFPAQIASGWAVVALTATEIIEAIQKQIDNREELAGSRDNSLTISGFKSLDSLMDAMGLANENGENKIES